MLEVHPIRSGDAICRSSEFVHLAVANPHRRPVSRAWVDFLGGRNASRARAKNRNGCDRPRGPPFTM
jgi:hypothetical protein